MEDTILAIQFYNVLECSINGQVVTKLRTSCHSGTPRKSPPTYCGFHTIRLTNWLLLLSSSTTQCCQNSPYNPNVLWVYTNCTMASSVSQTGPPFPASATLATGPSTAQASTSTSASSVMPSTDQQEPGHPLAKESNKYFKLKHSWGCLPNSNYLPASNMLGESITRPEHRCQLHSVQTHQHVHAVASAHAHIHTQLTTHATHPHTTHHTCHTCTHTLYMLSKCTHKRDRHTASTDCHSYHR